MPKIKQDRQLYHCSLEVLSPIHIGSGSILYPDSYIIDEKNKIYYRIFFAEYFEQLEEEKKKRLLELLERGNAIEIRKYIHSHYQKEYGYIYKGKVSSKIISDYLQKFKGSENKNENRAFEIEELIHSDFGHYIPGSTIKGAIRTAFLGKEFLNKDREYFIERNPKPKTKPFQEKKEKVIENKKLLSDLIGLSENEPKADPFKNLYVSDTNLTNIDIRVEEVKRWSKKSKNGSSVYQEVLDWERDTTYHFQILIKELQIEEEILEQLLVKRKRNEVEPKKLIKELHSFYIENIFSSLNDYAKRMIESDKKFYKTMSGNQDNAIRQKGQEVLNFYKELENIFNNLTDTEALIRIGKGTGFDSKTLNLFRKKPEEVYSMNVMDNMTMGWAKISYQEN